MDISSVWLRCVNLLHLADDLTSPSFHSWQNLTASSTLFNPSHVQLFTTPWSAAHQTPLSKGFPRQEYWTGLPFPSPGESSWSRDRTRVSCICRQIFFLPLSHQGSLFHHVTFQIYFLLTIAVNKNFFSWLLDLLSFFPSLCHSLIL